MSECGLRIKRSEIPRAGKGLFAARDFNRGEIISKNTGDLADDSDKFKGSKYILDMTEGDDPPFLFVDAARTNTAPARLINAPLVSGHPANCKFELDYDAQVARIVAIRHINKGEEFYINYGTDFWKGIKKQAKRRRKAAAPRVSREARRAVHRDSFSSSICALSTGHELPKTDPFTVKEAQRRSDWPQWQQAMQKEQDSLRERKVYTIAPSVPRGSRTIDTKWVFKLKRDSSGKPVRYKARLVVRGFQQREGVDFDQVYAPTVSYSSLRLLLAIAAAEQLEITAMDVETAYLYAPLEPQHKIFISTPVGFTGPETNNILRLDRALYGLKQGAHQWNRILDQALRNLGFSATTFYDECVYTKASRSGKLIYVTVYVDGILHDWHV